MQDKYRDAVILARRPLTDRITEFLIGAAHGTRLAAAEAGAHVELRFGGEDGRFLRHYSIVGPLDLRRDPEPFWRIAVQREDRSRGSAFIHRQFQIGTPLRISPPLNAFRLARNQPHVLLVAGGIGVTPIIAMARSLAIRQVNFSVFYAGLERAAMAYAGDLAGICGNRLTLHEAKTDGMPDLSALLAAQPEGTHAYVCGPPVMIEALVAAAANLGWTKDRVRSETFNAAHRPDDHAFDVRLRSGRTVHVGSGTTILDALEAVGIDTLSDCRRGECGLCITDVAACEGAIDHRDRYFGEEERRAGRQMTICCSRITGRVLDLDI